MKKEKVYNVIIAFICFAMWFMPTRLFEYRFVCKSFFGMLFSGTLFEGFAFTIHETWIFLLGCIAIVLLILNTVKDTVKIKIFATISSSLYVVLWIIAILVPFPSQTRILEELLRDGKTYIIWLLLYFAMLLAIIVLTTLQWLPTPRPTKAARLEARVAELEKKVEDLNKGE